MNKLLKAWPRYAAIAVCTVMLSGMAAAAQVSIGIAMPGLSIGINVPAYPQMVRVPDYPVYYAPGLRSNYFFYDGLYWIYQGDEWYVSDWYNGPWGWVQHEAVPLFILRIPVGYYRSPPPYFRGWYADAPPRWGEHWGPDWQRQRGGWDHWNRNAAPPPAPLPTYQRPYSGDRYPQPTQQQSLRGRNYTYQPQDEVARQHYRQPIVQATPAPSQRARPVEPDRDQARSQSNAPRAEPPQHDSAPQSVDERRAPSGNGGAQGQANAQRSAQPQRETAPTNAEQKKAPGGKSDAQGPSNAQHGAQSPREGSGSNGEQKKSSSGKESNGEDKKSASGKGSNGEDKKSSSGKGSGQDGKREQDGSPQRDGPQSNGEK